MFILTCCLWFHPPRTNILPFKEAAHDPQTSVFVSYAKFKSSSTSPEDKRVIISKYIVVNADLPFSPITIGTLLASLVLSKSIDFLMGDSVVIIVTAVVVELVVLGIGVTLAVFAVVVVVVVVIVVVVTLRVWNGIKYRIKKDVREYCRLHIFYPLLYE